MALLLAFLFLLYVAINDSLAVAAVQSLLALGLLYRLEGSFLRIRQGWGLLRWLLLPVLLLHVLFTPGELLFPPLPFSREGMQEGMWLAVHLVALLYAAMLLSRLLTLAAILPLLQSIPVARRLLPLYFALWPKLWQGMQAAVSVQQQAWVASGKRWRDLPLQLALIVVALDQQARQGLRDNADDQH